MNIPTQAIGFSLRRMYTTGSFFFFICTQSLGQAYAIHTSPDPKACHSSDSDDQIRRTFFFFLIRNSCDRLSCSSVCRHGRGKPSWKPATVMLFRSSYQEILPL